ncbi:PREDICTED: uncharacterized protein LOC107193567 isoform X1 [Dufourea novaeangliae]|uniref:uncharacterized protein LOC107193567 isoform X1 n=1 Tax=Dufourea novaeangliae TaxID=178035 RepID=UPI00076703E8|nr:PREDICTED: uncharacterized protein LOC107193567 isoform X1 [Dufourea novaeangliae]
MPKKHQVPMLVDLALYSIGEFVITFGRYMTKLVSTISKTNPEHGNATLCSMLEYMKNLLSSSVPRHLYNRMSVAVLTAVVNLVKETRGTYNDFVLTTAFLSEMTVALHLTEVAVGAHLKVIEFSAWPKIMRHVLYNKLHDMIGLEVLDLGSGSAGWRTSDIEKMIINGVSVMPNLVCFILCFDCTDNVIVALSQHCKKLQKLDVTASRSVTERSVAPLLTCKYLTQVKLCRTSMSIPGYANLFLEHSNIEDIGRCDEFGFVLELINQKQTDVKSTFHIKIFESRNFTMEHLYLLVGMCPYITSLCILRNERIVDLTILASLDYLKELKLLSCDFYAHGIKTLLEIKGSTIISLHLEHVEEIDLNALISISQYCPNIKSLMFYNCEFLERAPTYPRKLAVSPFQFLERIKCVSEPANMHLEFLLSHCENIKFIQLGSSTGIGDETMRRILLRNQMRKLEELKILYSHDLSMKTVQLLMENCDNLRRLSELENWQGISLAELNIFREELKSTNTNLDTSPSLSFA